MIEIIPAIDVIDGRCVRLEQGNFSRRTVYDADPVETARQLEAAGLKRLHLVDLDGARHRRIANLRVLKEIASATGLMIDFSGGISTADDITAVFEAGASIAAIGSLAVKSPDTLLLWLEQFGAERFLLGADVRGQSVAINGWQTLTDVEITAFLSEYLGKGIHSAFVTDIANDGLLKGPSIELYRSILKSLPCLNLIASGGVASLGDIRELESIGCRGVIVGKAIYEGHIKLTDLAAFSVGELP